MAEMIIYCQNNTQRHNAPDLESSLVEAGFKIRGESCLRRCQAECKEGLYVAIDTSPRYFVTADTIPELIEAAKEELRRLT